MCFALLAYRLNTSSNEEGGLQEGHVVAAVCTDHIQRTKGEALVGKHHLQGPALQQVPAWADGCPHEQKSYPTDEVLPSEAQSMLAWDAQDGSSSCALSWVSGLESSP